MPILAAVLAVPLLAGAAAASAAPAEPEAPAGISVAAPAALAEPGEGDAVAELSEDPVYVDPRAAGQLPADDADALADEIKDLRLPIFVVVAPEDPVDYPEATLFQDLRARVGVPGVYAIQLGDRFDARADPQVMKPDEVRALVKSVQREHPEGGTALLNDFVDAAGRQSLGAPPQSWYSGGDGDATGALVGLGVLAAVGAGGAYTIHRRKKNRREQARQAALDSLSQVVDEDITAYGEELDRLDFHPGETGADDAMREDYSFALDAYEDAKKHLEQAQQPGDIRAVTETLEGGRFALATLDARRQGKPLPERRSPCFFDPRHGPSVADAEWSPDGGVPRDVPVCAADRTRLAEGREPMARTVRTARGDDVPYWEAGPLYGPWAGGYFGAMMLPGILTGTLLGTAMASPAYAHYDPAIDGDFNSGDFDGGFDGGGFDGGGFDGGGGGFDGGGGSDGGGFWGGFGGGDGGGGFGGFDGGGGGFG